jgi:hypothetical protein
VKEAPVTDLAFAVPHAKFLVRWVLIFRRRVLQFVISSQVQELLGEQ